MNTSIFSFRRILGASVLFTFIVAMSASPALFAKKMPKIEICHFDDDTGLYHKINVSGNAGPAHLAHGDLLPGQVSQDETFKLDDDCNIVEDVVVVLFRGFIEFGTIDRIYDEVDDHEVFRVEDTDESGDLSVTDTLFIAEYPTVFDPDDLTLSDIGSYTSPLSFQIASILNNNFPFSVFFSVANGDEVSIRLGSAEGQLPTNNERWLIQSGTGFERTHIEDVTGGIAGSDLIRVDSFSPGEPDTTVPMRTQSNQTDDNFLQVVTH